MKHKELRIYVDFKFKKNISSHVLYKNIAALLARTQQ